MTDWPVAADSVSDRPDVHPARRASDRVTLAATARCVAVRRPCSAGRRRRGRAVASRATARRGDNDSDGSPGGHSDSGADSGSDGDSGGDSGGISRGDPEGDRDAGRGGIPGFDAHVAGAFDARPRAVLLSATPASARCSPGSPTARWPGPPYRALSTGMFAHLRVLAAALATGVGHGRGRVTTILVGWPRARGRMRTLRAAVTIPGEAMPSPAAGPGQAYALVPRDARSPVAFGIAAPLFPVRCWSHRAGNAVAPQPVPLRRPAPP
ncbi:hypothetical protein ACFT5C_28050 [Streptomyces sp. NPDC057116]|uniref:hypothetical protein n=1 Tax=Streptomyces sp. NPDC057116 TaxID=3346023 RepID=UPI0036383D8B